MWFLNVDDPQSDPNATGDPYKTLFVARLVSFFVASFTNYFELHSWYYFCMLLPIDSSKRLQNYETSEHRVKREFEAYGPIKRVSTCGKFQCRWTYSSLVRCLVVLIHLQKHVLRKSWFTAIIYCLLGISQQGAKGWKGYLLSHSDFQWAELFVVFVSKSNKMLWSLLFCKEQK